MQVPRFHGVRAGVGKDSSVSCPRVDAGETGRTGGSQSLCSRHTQRVSIPACFHSNPHAGNLRERNAQACTHNYSCEFMSGQMDEWTDTETDRKSLSQD